MSRSDLPRKFARRLAELMPRPHEGLAPCGLLIGLSGGPDSVALLLLAHHWAVENDRPLAAAHINHQLRAEASAQDATFCRDLCAQLNLRLFEHTDDPRPLARRRGTGLEDAARTHRRDFFHKILDENPEFSHVATAHHRDDQTETILMRLLRGTGPDGMAGIRPIAGRTLHPLLDTTRAEILEYLEHRHQPWRTDATNLTGDNTRSRVRRELLPVVRALFGEGADAAIARLAGLWEGDLAFLEQETLAAFASCQTTAEGALKSPALKIPALLELPPALTLRVLRRWLQDSGRVAADRIESIHLQNIREWLRVGSSGQGLDVPGGERLVRDFDILKIAPRGASHPVRNSGDFRILVAAFGPIPDPEKTGREEGNGHPRDDGSWNLTCPSTVLNGNLRIRNWRQGDRIHPLGLDGSRKLSDLFRERRLPAADRPGVLVVEDDDGILWVVGLARSERTRLVSPDHRHLTISVIPRRQANDERQAND